jgi:hypothetical protein
VSENGDFALMPKGGKRYISWWVQVFKGRSDLSAKTAHACFVILCMCLSVDVVMHTARCCAHFCCTEACNAMRAVLDNMQRSSNKEQT